MSGAKLTGQIGRWNIGMMHINDDRKTGFNHFTVVRVSRNLWKQSSVGVIATRGNALGLHENLMAGADLTLSTSTFQGNKNASVILFGLKSDTENAGNKDAAWGARFAYPNDYINLRLGHLEIGENFIAGMGFVPRTNIRETYSELQFGPRPNKWGIMQVLFGGGFDYITNLETGKLETSEFKINPLGIRLLSGEQIEYSIVSQYEFLGRRF